MGIFIFGQRRFGYVPHLSNIKREIATITTDRSLVCGISRFYQKAESLTGWLEFTFSSKSQ